MQFSQEPVLNLKDVLCLRQTGSIPSDNTGNTLVDASKLRPLEVLVVFFEAGVGDR